MSRLLTRRSALLILGVKGQAGGGDATHYHSSDGLGFLAKYTYFKREMKVCLALNETPESIFQKQKVTVKRNLMKIT